jgi:hypothetical protein
LPGDVDVALTEAFWSHLGGHTESSILVGWANVKTFSRFVREARVIHSCSDLHGAMLVRYVEWLNNQRKRDGSPWSKSSRASAYCTLRKLLQWLERFHPGTVPSIEYPHNPFPWRNRDTPPQSRLAARELRAILRACEMEIDRLRACRLRAHAERASESDKQGTLGWLLQYVDRHCDGIVPTAEQLREHGRYPVRIALARLGGLSEIEPYLYPRAEGLLPYYLAIMIHTAGNPDPIAELRRDCLQSLPLLDNREVVTWFKARANSDQRRTFSSDAPFEPPALVRDVLDWGNRLVSLAPTSLRDRLFIYKGVRGVTALTTSAIKNLVKAFCRRHGLPRFSLASIRPSVLTSFYRASGNLRQVAAIANHAHLSTTVRYVETPEVRIQNQERIAGLQDAFLGHIQKHRAAEPQGEAAADKSAAITPAQAVSMFGFDCENPYAGIAPGSRRNELCPNFMGCFTCPNAVITSQPSMLARLLQARDHLRAAVALMHPMRWQAFYAPQLRILEEDILTRFSATELAAAEPLLSQLAPLPDLR